VKTINQELEAANETLSRIMSENKLPIDIVKKLNLVRIKIMSAQSKLVGE